MQIPDMVKPIEGHRIWVMHNAKLFSLNIFTSMDMMNVFFSADWSKGRVEWPVMDTMKAICKSGDGIGKEFQCPDREQYFDLQGVKSLKMTELYGKNDSKFHFSNLLSKCGIGAYKTAAHMVKDGLVCSTMEQAVNHPGAPQRVAFGKVFLWGNVIEHETGYRAECAYPKSLYVPAVRPKEYDERLKVTALRYNIPVEVYHE